jgi:site-specific recombinase XerD
VTQKLPGLLDYYLLAHTSENHTWQTIRFYRKELRLFFSFLQQRGHSLDIQDLSPLDVMSHLKDLTDRGRKPRTRRSRLQAIKSFLKWAYEWEFIPEAQYLRVKRIKPPKLPREYKPFPPETAFRAMLDLCPLDTFLGARRAAVLWVLATTGIRHEELTGLQLQDVHFGEMGYLRVMGKGQKVRTVFLPRSPGAPVQQTLLRYLQHRRNRFDHTPADCWVTEEGKSFGYWGISQDLSRLAQRAGVKGQVVGICHAWRRGAARDALRHQIPKPYILQHMGWSTPTMLDHYTEAMELEEGEALCAFQGVKPFGKRRADS